MAIDDIPVPDSPSPVRTGRRELSRLLDVPRKTYHADRGVRREDAKRLNPLSARQQKIQRKFTKRWFTNNKIWFGVAEAGKVGDKRIPCANE